MNVCNFTGRLGKDPEPIGSTGAKFSFAVDGYDYSTKSKITVWLDCVVWGKDAERLLAHTEKGSALGITTRYELREREHNGKTYKNPTFIVEHWDFLPANKPSSGGGFSGAPSTPAAEDADEEKLWA